MRLPPHKTKIVATVGPASKKRKTLEAMVKAGMSVARINFAHGGDLEEHARVIETVRDVSRRLNRPWPSSVTCRGG